MSRLLLASDFDGTLASIRATPEEVKIDREAAEFLNSAARSRSVHVAIISGRDLSDLRERTRGVRAWLAGAHGLEVAAPDGSTIRLAQRWSGIVPGAWLAAAREKGLRVEQKRYGVALHWRGVEEVDSTHPLVRDFAAWAAGEGLDLIPGRMVLEARLSGADKVDALSFLAETTAARRIVYAGDDLTDVPALRWAASRGRALFVRSSERTENLPDGIEQVGSVAELLDAFREEIE